MKRSTEAIRRAVEVGMCPWCDAGPFDVVALHTNSAHGVDARELRELAGLFYSDSLTSERYHLVKSEIARRLYDGGTTLTHDRGGPGVPHRLSPAAIELQRQKALRQTPASRKAAGRKLSRRRRDESAERDRKITAAVRGGEMTYDQIAGEFGVHPRTVQTIARRSGVDIDGRTRPANRRRKAQAQTNRETLDRGRALQADKMLQRGRRLVAAFQEGRTVYDLASQEGISVKSMRALLRKYGADVPDGRSDPHRLHGRHG